MEDRPTEIHLDGASRPSSEILATHFLQGQRRGGEG